LSDWLQAGAIETQGPTDDCRRCATTSTMSDITVGPGPDLAETPPRTCSRAVAQNNRSPPGQQKAITTGEGNRLRSSFHTQPAVAARKHGEMRQICGGNFLPEGVTFSSVCFSCIKPHGAVASSLC